MVDILHAYRSSAYSINSASIAHCFWKEDLRPLKMPLLVLCVLDNCQNPSPLCCPFTVSITIFIFVFLHSIRTFLRPSGQPSSAIYQVLQLATSELCTFDAEDERDGVHEVGLACTIRPYDRGEVVEWTNGLMTSVMTEMSYKKHCEVSSPTSSARSLKGFSEVLTCMT